MVAMQIRDVPDQVRQVLVERARARGQSLQAFLLSLVEAEARRAENLAVLDGVANRADGSRLTVEQASTALDQARAERDVELNGRSGSGVGGAA